MANNLEVVHGSVLEIRAWGGTSIRVPQYNLEILRAGFILLFMNLVSRMKVRLGHPA